MDTSLARLRERLDLLYENGCYGDFDEVMEPAWPTISAALKAMEDHDQRDSQVHESQSDADSRSDVACGPSQEGARAASASDPASTRANYVNDPDYQTDVLLRAPSEGATSVLLNDLACAGPHSDKGWLLELIQRARDEIVRLNVDAAQIDADTTQEYLASDKRIAALEQELSQEREAHAQLQARCYDQGGTFSNVFDECAALKSELAALRSCPREKD